MSYGTIYIGRIPDADYPYAVDSWKEGHKIHYTKYNIKETDHRIKTATFTSPQYIDLTTGEYCILINSKYHENFGGIILDVEYDRKTGLYTYQCQDWSRRYMWKSYLRIFNVSLYRILQAMLTKFNVNVMKRPINKAEKEAFKNVLSGLRPSDKYNQSLYKGNVYKGNPFKEKPSFIAKDKTAIEIIRSLVFNSLGYFDIWFNDRGILQIEPISKTDWENTGLYLTNNEYYNSKFKFNTTNVITGVIVNASTSEKSYDIGSENLFGLNLKAFFGDISTSINNPNDNKDTSKSVSTNKNTGSTANNKYNNPYNNKPKRAWINADNGSDGMKHNLANALKKDGWTVHISGTGPNWHYTDYWDVTSNYSVLLMLMNGFCAGTMREAYSSKIQNVLKKKGVQLVPIWETGGWTNPNGMKPYRYGDFTGYNAKRAWDDNFSNSDPSIKNVSDFLKKNKATYCASPTTSEIMQQFRAGGYFKYKGINV